MKTPPKNIEESSSPTLDIPERRSGGPVSSLLVWLFSDAARPLRFIITGGTAGLIQLALLTGFERIGWNAVLANGVAFLLAAQVNFLLSSFFTWHDRPLSVPTRALTRRWLAFHGSIGSTALLNEGVFILAHLWLPSLVSSALGICVAAIINFLVINHYVFVEKRELHVHIEHKSATPAREDQQKHMTIQDDDSLEGSDPDR